MYIDFVDKVVDGYQGLQFCVLLTDFDIVYLLD